MPTASARYFSGTTELQNVTTILRTDWVTLYPGTATPVKADSFSVWVGWDKAGEGRPLRGYAGALPVTRKIFYKDRPSLHECDARCMNGRHNGSCECRCGGKNHGIGQLIPSLS